MSAILDEIPASKGGACGEAETGNLIRLLLLTFNFSISIICSREFPHQIINPRSLNF